MLGSYFYGVYGIILCLKYFLVNTFALVDLVK